MVINIFKAIVIIFFILLLAGCSRSASESSAQNEVEGLKVKLHELSKSERLSAWIEFSKHLPTNEVERILCSSFSPLEHKLMTATNAASLPLPSAFVTSIWRNKAYSGYLFEAVKWEGNLSDEESANLNASVGPILKLLQQQQICGFEANPNSCTRLYLTPNIILLLAAGSEAQRTMEVFDRYASQGHDPRGDWVLKIKAGVYIQTERR